MSSDILDRIIKRKFKYIFASYLLSSEDYWGYLYTEQLHHRSWAFKFLFIECIFFLGLLIILLINNASYFSIGFVIAILIFSILLNGFYSISSQSARSWWISLILVASSLVIFSCWFLFVIDPMIMLFYLSASHLMALIKARKYIKN